MKMNLDLDMKKHMRFNNEENMKIFQYMDEDTKFSEQEKEKLYKGILNSNLNFEDSLEYICAADLFFNNEENWFPKLKDEQLKSYFLEYNVDDLAPLLIGIDESYIQDSLKFILKNKLKSEDTKKIIDLLRNEDQYSNAALEFIADNNLNILRDEIFEISHDEYDYYEKMFGEENILELGERVFVLY